MQGFRDYYATRRVWADGGPMYLPARNMPTIESAPIGRYVAGERVPDAMAGIVPEVTGNRLTRPEARPY